MKSLVAAAVCALALGGAFGALLTQGYFSQKLDSSDAQVQEQKSRAKRLEQELKEARDASVLLRDQLAELQQQTASLQNKAGTRKDEPVASIVEEVSEAADDAPAVEDKKAAKKAAKAAAGTADAEPLTPEEQAAQEVRRTEMRERRQQFEQAVKDRVETFLQDEATRATDADSQQRMQLLQQYAGEMMALRTSMREAQTDEERQVLRDSMRDTYGNIEQVIQQQQESMLRTLASNSGISDVSKQDAFVAQAREMQSSPFFQAERLLGPAMMGGGGSRWGGGNGGPRGGGERQ